MTVDCPTGTGGLVPWVGFKAIRCARIEGVRASERQLHIDVADSDCTVAQLEVEVTSRDGDPVEGAAVRLQQLSGSHHFGMRSKYVPRGKTKVARLAAIPNVLIRRYSVRVTADGFDSAEFTIDLERESDVKHVITRRISLSRER